MVSELSNDVTTPYYDAKFVVQKIARFHEEDYLISRIFNSRANKLSGFCTTSFHCSVFTLFCYHWRRPLSGTNSARLPTWRQPDKGFKAAHFGKYSLLSYPIILNLTSGWLAGACMWCRLVTFIGQHCQLNYSHRVKVKVTLNVFHVYVTLVTPTMS